MKKIYQPPKSFRIKSTGLLILFLSVFITISQAQVRTITGVVKAGDTQETLPGATIVTKGTTAGAVTDIDGKYSITVKAEKTILVFSYVGYITKEVELGSSNIVNVLLDPQKITLDEIVVIGYGSIIITFCLIDKSSVGVS